MKKCCQACLAVSLFVVAFAATVAVSLLATAATGFAFAYGVCCALHCFCVV